MPGTRTIRRGIVRTAALVALALVTVSTGSASAKDRIYWANRDNNTLAFANLDGSGATKLNVPAGVTVASPSGITLDPAAGRIYWTNRGGCPNNAIAWMNLDGSAGGHINVTGATCDTPVASAIDPRTRRIYWANFAAPATGHSKISFARLNGSGGGDLSTTATVDQPFGVAIDPGLGRIYWTNTSLATGTAGTIAFANLDGSGGGNVNVGTAHVNDPSGVAVDPTTRLIYWANFMDVPGTVSFANLNGTGGGQLNTNPIAPSFPEGVAVDIPGGRVYWANLGSNTISFANVNNIGGGNLSTTGVSVVSPVFPAILRIPSGTGTPRASGGSTVGSTLSCTTGSWAGDILPALLYRAPQRFAFHWTVNGSPVGGATGSTTTANAAGGWRCVVTASNAAGARSQTSSAVTIFGDRDRDGILDPRDRCPNRRRGRFDKDRDGCPGPYARLRISIAGTWSVSSTEVQIGTMSARRVRRGVKVKLSCPACHVKQTLRAKRRTLALKKLSGKSLRRGEGFTLTATKRGFIGDRLTLTVKQYGTQHEDLVRAAREPFTMTHRCLPVGSRKPARKCSARPRTGP